MPDDLVEKYKDNIRDPKRPVMYQLAKVMLRDHYEDGYVSEIYDECFVVKRGNGNCSRFDFNDKEDFSKVMLLHENGKPVIAPTNLFGKRRFTR